LKTPDIEIYVKHSNSTQLKQWLEQNFELLAADNLNEDHFSKGKTIKVQATLGSDQVSIPIVITPHSAGKAFCSIWIQSDKTPWQNDEECAMSFLSFSDTEVRCSSSSWSESEEKESEQWLCLSRNEKKLINWR